MSGGEDVVHCDNGFEVYVNGTLTGQTCLDACGGANNTNCCAGNGDRVDRLCCGSLGMILL